MNIRTGVLVSLIGVALLLLLFGCTTQDTGNDTNNPQDNNSILVGGDRDAHGCIPSAGYSWCEAKQKCLRVWEEACDTNCGTCPQLSPPSPDFCKNGQIVAGEKDACGCATPPTCEDIACTMDALLCPDGNAVGRIAPDCRFAACPNCTCPEGYVQEGQTCNPRCYYSTPKCLQPSKSCSPTTQTTNNNSNTQIANPASVNCIDQNGTLEIVDTNEGQVGICTLPNGHVCEEWALFRGECS